MGTICDLPNKIVNINIYVYIVYISIKQIIKQFVLYLKIIFKQVFFQNIILK